MTNDKVFVKNDSESKNSHQSYDENEEVSFEDAVTITGFGKFNVMLILLSMPGIWAPVVETTTMSYTFAAAQCDLGLSLEDKGYLNAITYAGTITSAALWGFLYDTLGRKRLLVGGFLLDAFFAIISSFSQSIVPLMVCKFLGGFIINGPYAATMTYLSEFHCSKHRPRIQLLVGTINGSAGIILPLLAWAILPQSWNISFFDGYIKIHSWNIYLLICCIPILFSGIIFLFLPESPKFLMTVGKNEEALQVFQKVYSLNTGKFPESFPVKRLIDETNVTEEGNNHGGYVTSNRSMVQALKEGWQQITPLFYPPYISKLLLVCFIQFCGFQSLNMLRLWMPQIFQAINDYKYYNNDTGAGLCTMLQVMKPSQASDECTVNMDNSDVYINSIIVAATTVCGYSLTGTIITFFGKKKIMITVGFLAGIASFSIYFSQDTTTVIILSSLFIALSSVCTYVLLAAIVDLFPTTLRTLTLALTMMLGRTGAMLGNLLFPLLLRLGCELPFFYIGSLIIVSALFSFMLPNTDNKALK